MIIVLLLYLVILCVIAIHSTMNVKSVPDFFVARKGASVKAVAGSLVASILGGSAIIGAIDESSRLGSATAWFMLVGALGLVALIPFAKKAYSLGKYSLPDLIENMYGKAPRIVSSIVIPVAWTGIVAAQIIAAAKILQSFTPLGYETCAVIFAAVFTLYTIAGGQFSILRTDFLQAALIVAGLAALAIFVGINVSDSYTLSEAPAFPFNKNFSPFDLFILMLTYGTTFTAGPDMFSRLFCAKDSLTAKKSLLVAAAVLVPVASIIGFLSAFGANIESTGGARIISIANIVVPQALLPFIAIVLLSVVLSSADTLLLSSSVILCGLFMPSETWQKKETNANAQKKSLLVARAVIFVNGLVALTIALHFTNIIGILLMALAIYAGAFTVPILWGLSGFRTKTAYVSAAIIAGGCIALIGKFLPMLPDSWNFAHTAGLESALLIASFIVNAGLLLIGRIRKN